MLIKFTEQRSGLPKTYVTKNKAAWSKNYEVHFAPRQELLVIAELYQAGKPMQQLGQKIFSSVLNPRDFRMEFTRSYENRSKTILTHTATVRLGEQVFPVLEFKIHRQRNSNDEGWGWYTGEGLRKLRQESTGKIYAKLESLFYYHDGGGEKEEDEAQFWVPGPLSSPPGQYQFVLKMIPVDQLQYLVTEPVVGWQGLDGKTISSDLTVRQSETLAREYKRMIETAVEDIRMKTAKLFTAQLANGVTVQLLGVCEHPSKGKQWWKPDGTSLEVIPYLSPDVYVDQYDGYKCYEVALNIVSEHLPKRIKWKPPIYIIGAPLSTTDLPVCVDLRPVVLRVPEGQDTTSLRIGIDPTSSAKEDAKEYEWVTFKNVSLKPNFKTDVEVEVELAWGEAVNSMAVKYRPERRASVHHGHGVWMSFGGQPKL